MKSLISLLLSIFAIVILFPIGTFAHSGRTDKYGGHWNKKTGTYHYHSKKAVKKHVVKKHYKKHYKKY